MRQKINKTYPDWHTIKAEQKEKTKQSKRTEANLHLRHREGNPEWLTIHYQLIRSRILLNTMFFVMGLPQLRKLLKTT
jgi:hypothetical protein